MARIPLEVETIALALMQEDFVDLGMGPLSVNLKTGEVFLMQSTDIGVRDVFSEEVQAVFYRPVQEAVALIARRALLSQLKSYMPSVRAAQVEIASAEEVMQSLRALLYPTRPLFGLFERSLPRDLMLLREALERIGGINAICNLNIVDLLLRSLEERAHETTSKRRA